MQRPNVGQGKSAEIGIDVLSHFPIALKGLQGERFRPVLAEEFLEQRGQRTWDFTRSVLLQFTLALHFDPPCSLRVLCFFLGGKATLEDLLAVPAGRARRVKAICPGLAGFPFSLANRHKQILCDSGRFLRIFANGLLPALERNAGHDVLALVPDVGNLFILKHFVDGVLANAEALGNLWNRYRRPNGLFDHQQLAFP